MKILIIILSSMALLEILFLKILMLKKLIPVDTEETYYVRTDRRRKRMNK